jgi:4-hydroxybenzoate polyprenyltransferase
MGFNRIADRDLDAKNPRTSGRELPAGRLTLGQAWGAVAVAAALFLWSAWALNPICFRLSPIVLAVVTLYSYSKRFTWWSHLWLGFGDAMAGPAGYLAVSGQWTDPWWLLWMMAAAVTFWIGGFDIFYALQDEVFDRVEGLQSAVVRFGQVRGIFFANAARSHGAGPRGVRRGRGSELPTTWAWGSARRSWRTNISW